MKIHFNSVKIKNFLSIEDADIELCNRGYCVVRGVNNCPTDASLSSGSGKSSIWSAICWALTGETVQGIKSNLANRQNNCGCSVELNFNVDNTEYVITRYRDDPVHKTDLKIKINGEDSSGKGIRESEELLSQYLPDLTSELIGSVIIIGQGMPYKFSNNTPSGRKEVLEKLSKSDFMIEDIKERISLRSAELNSKMKEVDDALLVSQSKLSVYEQQLKVKEELFNSNYLNEPNFDERIYDLDVKMHSIDEEINLKNSTLKELKDKLNTISDELININSKKADAQSVITTTYNNNRQVLLDTKSNLSAEITSTSAEVARLDAITDVCPTCGQKLIGVEKPDTTKLHEKLDELNKSLNSVVAKMSELSSQYRDDFAKIDTEFANLISNLTTDKYKCNSDITALEREIGTLKSGLSNLQVEHKALVTEKSNFTATKNTLISEIETIKTSISSIEENKVYNNNVKSDLQRHIDTINKMSTLVKRDFRGFLLSGVIEYINNKAKEYCADVFGTNEIAFELDGNNINISYCGKPFENLSGGEKQRVDLIIQFAIRDMLSRYLNFSANILVLDEIFDGLDIMCTTNVLSLISKRLNDIENVYIVSHNETLQIPYDNEIVVTKDERGVSVVR